MAEHMQADPASVHATAQWLKQAADELSDRIDAHMKIVRGFIGGDWQGTAAQSHQQLWAQWEDGARQVVESFRADAGSLHATASAYTTIDTNRAQSTTGLSSSLDLPEP